MIKIYFQLYPSQSSPIPKSFPPPPFPLPPPTTHHPPPPLIPPTFTPAKAVDVGHYANEVFGNSSGDEVPRISNFISFKEIAVMMTSTWCVISWSSSLPSFAKRLQAPPSILFFYPSPHRVGIFYSQTDFAQAFSLKFVIKTCKHKSEQSLLLLPPINNIDNISFDAFLLNLRAYCSLIV